MKTNEIRGVLIEYPNEFPEELLTELLTSTEADYQRTIKKIEVTSFDEKGVDVIITPYTEIVRLRRITGYLSRIENFNAPKKAEALDRIAHL